MKTNFDIDQIQVASPCHARWNDMSGDERARFCGQCSKHVFNLSAMTRAQIETLVIEKEGKFCGRFHRRADGTMLTADCPSRLRRVRARLARLGGALCALALSVVGCSARRSAEVTMGVIAVPPQTCSTNLAPEIMGKITLPEPPEVKPRALMGEISVGPTNVGDLKK